MKLMWKVGDEREGAGRAGVREGAAPDSLHASPILRGKAPSTRVIIYFLFYVRPEACCWHSALPRSRDSRSSKKLICPTLLVFFSIEQARLLPPQPPITENARD